MIPSSNAYSVTSAIIDCNHANNMVKERPSMRKLIARGEFLVASLSHFSLSITLTGKIRVTHVLFFTGSLQKWCTVFPVVSSPRVSLPLSDSTGFPSHVLFCVSLLLYHVRRPCLNTRIILSSRPPRFFFPSSGFSRGTCLSVVASFSVLRLVALQN